MSERNDYQELASRLNEERARLDYARAQYETITGSRFHALRMAWFSLKHFFGKTSPSDVYAVWSTATAVRVPPGRIPANGAVLANAEQTLVEAWNARMAERTPQPPLVTVIIPVFNHRAVTTRCLQSIATSWFESLPVQFIVVDDGSTDDTAALVTNLQGVDYVYNSRNEGFVHACNRGAQLARGKYICFLNNDTVVRDGWLDHLVNTIERDETIGVVGSKLVYPDGRLQEAGAVVWRNATGWNVGRNEDPNDPRFNFVRDVDYVSGAALLIRRDLFFRVGGFSDEFRPAYYEDVDLCFKVHALGARVVYQPRSVVVHYESVTSGNERTGIKRFQEINRPKFFEKWAVRLDSHLANDRANTAIAMHSHVRGRTVLLVDSYVPMHDREAGSRRMFHVINILIASGYKVVFLPDNFTPVQPYTDELQQMGVQVLHHIDGGAPLHEALEQVLPSIDVAWISRPELYQKYAPIVRRQGGIRLIYDTVDLHHVRKQREAALSGGGDAEWREWQRIEAEAARTADATVVVTAEEKDILRELGVEQVFVVPTIHEPASVPHRRFEDTSGLLFVGNYNHPPNGDAAQWLCQSVMPHVWNALPEIRLTLAGSNPDDALRGLRSERVSVTGYVRDMAPYFRKARVFVAPLRFGAGMKGKIGQALEYSVPIITTPIGAEGFDLRDGENAIIAKADAREFANAIIALYSDGARWQRISREAKKAIQPFTPQTVVPKVEAVFAAVRESTG
jgi:GT2 family glycosyltransferase